MASRPLARQVPGILFALAIATALPVVWIYAVPIFALTGIAAHSPHGPLIFVHALGGLAMLALGAAALFIGWTRRGFRRHKWVGYAYLLVGGVGAVTALLLSILSAHEPASLYVATGTLSVAWLAVAAMAYRAARNRRFESHREWMIRSYVLSWTFVGCRIANLFSLFPSLGGEAVTAQIWMFWIVPYLLCEMALQWKRGAAGAASAADRDFAPAPAP